MVWASFSYTFNKMHCKACIALSWRHRRTSPRSLQEWKTPAASWGPTLGSQAVPAGRMHLCPVHLGADSHQPAPVSQRQLLTVVSQMQKRDEKPQAFSSEASTDTAVIFIAIFSGISTHQAQQCSWNLLCPRSADRSLPAVVAGTLACLTLIYQIKSPAVKQRKLVWKKKAC